MPRSGRSLLPVLLAVLIVLGVGGVAWWLFGPSSRPSVDEGRAVTDDFLAAIREGDPDRAWQSTTAEFKSTEGRESFRQTVTKNPVLKEPLEFLSVEPVTVGDRPRDQYLYARRGADGAVKTVRLLLANENGVWKVDRMAVQ